ncbi:MAG: NAD(P)-dependent alcohol dehydrogenase [Xenophilus sp.]
MTDDTALQRWTLLAFGLAHLRRESAPIPQPGPGEVLVRVEAASLNFRDLLIAEDRYGRPVTLPLVPASDLAGRVQAAGAGVTRWRGGERVISTFIAGWHDGAVPPASSLALGMPGPGALATHVLLREDWLVDAPATLDAAGASTLPCAGLTAWTALVEHGPVKAGQTVLVHGTGGVALFGVQLAKLHGARVIVVSGSPAKHDAVRALGADHVLARGGDWPAEVKRLSGGRGADHVLELAGGDNLGRSLEALATGGHVAYIGTLQGDGFAGSGYELIRTQALVRGVGVGHRRGLEELVRAVDAGGLQPVVAAEYPADQVPAAFEHLARGPFGKVVVRFG